jgi:uncharacterized DUF497 family protein
MRFRWNAHNIEHIGAHDITPAEAEYVVDHARTPFPEMIGKGKRYVAGRTWDAKYVQVIYILDSDATAYVIHARPLTDAEKQKFRRRTK